MKVWVVVKTYCNEYEGLVGVYSSEALAEQAADLSILGDVEAVELDVLPAQRVPYSCEDVEPE